MSINAYTGLQGSGKSYEVVLSVVIPAITQGRRVITNIDGIDSDAIRAYINEKDGIALSNLGEAVYVENSVITEPNFFPTNYQSNNAGEQLTVVKNGDLVAIDEAWRFWGTDCKISEEHRIFFREHRHFINPETGVSCDLVLMVQDISDIHRILKVVVELSFRTHKAKALGLNNTYNISMWEGYKQHQKNVVSDWTRSYDKKIFPLYKSYSGSAQGTELATDKRQNIFNDKRLIFKIIFMIVACIFAGYKIFIFFNEKIHPTKQQNAPSIPIMAAPQQTQPTHNDTDSTEWRIVGTVDIDGFKSVVLASKTGLRFESVMSFTGFGSNLSGVIDGKRVTRFTGNTPEVKNQK